jgi:Amino-terminal Zinc-binding domain of ubiquitin ligase E3A
VYLSRFITQLRTGCGSNTCSTATCFSCRKRLVGKAPIRRYNITSARTLAIYLASQDNPENALCPNLRASPAPSAAVNSLIFTPKRPAPARGESILKTPNGYSQSGSPKEKPLSDLKSAGSRSRSGSRQPEEGELVGKQLSRDRSERNQTSGSSNSPEFTVTERIIVRLLLIFSVPWPSRCWNG